MIPTLLHRGADLQVLPALFVTGRRGTARVDLAHSEIRHIAFAPTEAFRSIHWHLPAQTTEAQIYTNHLVHDLRWSMGGSLRITVIMARTEAWMALLLEPSVPESEATDLELDLIVTPNLDYIHKFQHRGQHQYEFADQGMLITTPDHPELLAFLRSDLALQWPSLRMARGSIESSLVLKIPLDRSGVICFGSGYHETLRQQIETLDCTRVQQELEQIRQSEQEWIDQGAQLICPDPVITRFFQLCRSWFHKSIRRLPFGPAYTPDLQANQEIDVVSASPDYHGVFANDCIQSSLEGMIVAPQLQTCYRQGLEALYHHAVHLGDQIPESIELIFGEPRLFYAQLRIGQHPEWIISYASLVLLTGDRELGQRLWPGLQLALNYFHDPWEVGLNIWDTSAYPEQPDTQGYNFGRVYAQAWWIWAFQLGAELAGFLGYPTEKARLRICEEKARTALETYFGRSDGYGSWLSETGDLHPHQDHEVIIPIALGVAPPARAEQVITTILSPNMWVDPLGPKRSDHGHETQAGDWVWGFMRWNLIQALCQYDHLDQAISLAHRWAEAELSAGLKASEVFSHSTATGITGEGYVWTAARATRALSLGLFGIKLRQEGLEIDPKLPPAWSEMGLLNLHFRGQILDIVVKRAARSRRLNGQDHPDTLVKAIDLERERNTLIICVERPASKHGYR